MVGVVEHRCNRCLMSINKKDKRLYRHTKGGYRYNEVMCVFCVKKYKKWDAKEPVKKEREEYYEHV